MLGAVTLLLQQRLPGQCFGLGAMLLGVALSFGTFALMHDQRSGWLAALLVLIILLGNGWLAAGLLLEWRRERATWEEAPAEPPVSPPGPAAVAPPVLLTVVSVPAEGQDGEEP